MPGRQMGFGGRVHGRGSGVTGGSEAWWAPTALALGAALASVPAAAADGPSAARPSGPAPPRTTTATTAAFATATDRGALDPNRIEYGLLPALNYNSDLGVGVGAVGTLVAFEPGLEPYRWRAQATIFLTLRDQGDGIEVPVQSHSVIFDRPGLMNQSLRLRFAVGFNRQINTGYYGLGSNAPDESAAEERDPTFTQYDRVFPEAGASARIRLWSEPVPVGKRRLELFVGATFRYTWFDVFEDSRLALDRAQARRDPRLAELLRGVEDHALLVLRTGLLFDTRDREFDPQAGAFHELSARVSPGVDASLAFAGFALIARWYLPLIRDRLVLATRTAGDLIVGDAPVYELARLGAFEPIDAPGGAQSLRAVPLRRFHGKVKLLQSLELRARLAPFRLGSQRFMFGAATFVDAGRVWADVDGGAIDVLQPDGSVTRRRLDDGLSDFELGVGGGLRLRWGETFIIRLDVAYAPTLETFGFYIDVGDSF